MDEAELAQILGEAMRVKSYEIRSGTGLKPFLPLAKGKVATIEVHLSGDGQLNFLDIHEKNAISSMRQIEIKPQQEEVKPKRKEKIYSVEDSYTKRT